MTKKPAKHTEATKTSADTPPERFPIVGIGASAGGLEAFEKFFRAVPADCAMAFVLVPHLDPDHASLLSEILQRVTTLPVAEATAEQRVAPGHVYVIPPNRDMSISRGTLHLATPEHAHGQRMPIDDFLSSLATDRGRDAIGVVLSGTGHDGTRGLRAIIDAGGIALVQDPSTAQYDGMPVSAIEAGAASHTLPTEDMPALLARVVVDRANGKVPAPPPQEALPVTLAAGSALDSILTALRSATGHDFSHYKKNTILRRIARRMAAQETDDAEHYARMLRHDSAEVDALFKELLINVSGFFRDADAFVALKDDVLRPYLADRPDDFVFRAWVAGCANGEEAYSIAIVLHELMMEMQRPIMVQIYATDLDEDAIGTARSGSYPRAIAADITPERLKRCFTTSGTRYRINKTIRDMVIFAEQNMIKDPPFTRLDLLSCRNVMIYLEPDLQTRLIRTFHYALNTGGTLFISPSENIGDHMSLFTAISRKWKLYRATAASPALRALPTGPLRWATLPYEPQFEFGAPADSTRDFAAITRGLLVHTFAPPSVLVDARGDILYVHGDTEAYLRPAPGHATLNVVSMARPALQPALFSALQAAAQPTRQGAREIVFPDADSPHKVGITVQPLPPRTNGERYLLISFQPIEPAPAAADDAVPRGGNADADAQRIESLERDLAYTHEKLQSIIEEQQASNEELKATNEEMQSSNEELQSANEELETSKEELHSINEELMSVNAELQAKIVQLNDVQNDLKNLLDNVGTGVIFLDDQLSIRRFTREASQLYPLVAGDVGRPLADIKSAIVGDAADSLLSAAGAVLDTVKPYEAEVHTHAGNAFLLQIDPYRTVDNVIDGVVLTFTDITARLAADARETEGRLREALEKAARQLAESIVDTVRQPMLVLDGDLNVVSAGRAFYTEFGVTAEDTLGSRVYALGNNQFDIPALRDLLEKVLPQDNAFDDYTVSADFPGIGQRELHLSGRRIIAEKDATPLILLAIDM